MQDLKVIENDLVPVFETSTREKELGFSPEVGKDDYIPESLFYRLGMKI